MSKIIMDQSQFTSNSVYFECLSSEESEQIELDNVDCINDIDYEQIREELEDYISDNVAGILKNLFFGPRGQFNGYDMEDEILHRGEEEINTKFANATIQVIESSNGKITKVKDIKDEFLLWMHEQLAGYSGDEFLDGWVAHKVSDSIEAFEKDAAWFIGAMKKDELEFAVEAEHYNPYLLGKSLETETLSPIIWFGLLNEPPIDIWTIDSQTTIEDLRFWFLDMNDSITNLEDEFAEYIISDYCGWYWDIGGYVVDFEQIRKSCPIPINDILSTEDLVRALNELI